MLLAPLGSKANVVSPGRHSARETALRRSDWQPCARRLRLQFTKRAIAPVYLWFASATMEDRDRQGSQDGFSTATSAVSCDDMVTWPFRVSVTARRVHARQTLTLGSKRTLIVRIVKRIAPRIHTWRLLIGDEIFNT
jgi:hypothetical protein